MLLFYLQYNKGAGGSRQGQLTGSGGNRRLLLASLHNRYFIVRTGHFVSLLSVIGGWGGVLPPHFGQKKSRQPFSDFLLGVPLCGRRVFSCKSSGQVDPMCEWQTGSSYAYQYPHVINFHSPPSHRASHHDQVYSSFASHAPDRKSVV